MFHKEMTSELAAIAIAALFAGMLYQTMVDIENLQAANRLLQYELTATKIEVVALRKHIDERTHPATIQREQFNWIMREGKE